MKKKIILLLLLTITIGMTGCKKFLDVEPKTNLSETQLFSSEAGFQQALSGVYAQLASRSLYGDRLTMGFVSALAQNYAVSGSTAPYVETRALNYASTEVQGHIAEIWAVSYSAVSGINKILSNTVTNKALLSDTAYATIRGEALALRALVHFDLLRMFGKQYGAGADLKAIPYRTVVDENAKLPNTTAEVINFALADLKEAEDLLKLLDPIVARDLRTRRNKLNYYGVKGLEARIRLYMGDKPGAAAAATIVVNSGKYTWVTQAEASANGTTVTTLRDRLYLNEQVFMLRSRDLNGWTETYFRSSGVNLTSIKLTRTQANFNTIYESSSTDYRLLYRIETENNAPFPSKFWQNSSTQLSETRRDQYVPVIRLSEMYYILAETAETTGAGIAYLNTVRQNRALSNLVASTPANLIAEITKEYQKEFYAEGQLFFYYKRINATSMQLSNSGAMTPARYVLPIPNTELEYNPNYN
jgi:hypothetical protein